MRHTWTQGAVTITAMTHTTMQTDIDGGAARSWIEFASVYVGPDRLADPRYDPERGMLNGYRNGNRFDIIIPDDIRSKIFGMF